MNELTRRRFLVTTGLALGSALGGAALAGAPSARADTPRRMDGMGGLGANFNQNLDALSFRELEEAGAEWVRGFYRVWDADDGDPADHYAIRTLVEAADRGYHTILSLKFPYNRTPFPQPGSEAMAAELARLDRILPAVLGKVDILTIGNEPFIESLKEQRDERLNEFYETITRYVVAYRDGGDGTRLYLGALNRLDLADHRTPAVERWMAFARATPEIEGVDIHPHVPDPANVQPFLDYVLPRMRADQTFLCTEFSLVWYWRDHLQDPISAGFADRYGFGRDTLVWQVISAAIEQPFRERQWDDFLSSSPWFMRQQWYVRDQVERFRSTGRLAATTYGFKQDVPMTTNFGPNKPPWLLNSVYARYTVRPRGEGLSGRGWWVDQFRTAARLMGASRVG